MPIQTQAEAEVELATWYAARAACAAGKSFTIVTTAGTRVLTYQSLEEINAVIVQLERKVAATTGTAGGYSFALSNFNNGAQR